jgi:hypothetical protein
MYRLGIELRKEAVNPQWAFHQAAQEVEATDPALSSALKAIGSSGFRSGYDLFGGHSDVFDAKALQRLRAVSTGEELAEAIVWVARYWGCTEDLVWGARVQHSGFSTLMGFGHSGGTGRVIGEMFDCETPRIVVQLDTTATIPGGSVGTGIHVFDAHQLELIEEGRR